MTPVDDILEIENPCHPPFMDLLDAEPARAADQFYAFTVKLLTVHPPREFASISAEQREDLIQEVVVHCISDKFRQLRSYRDAGRPFAAWLYIIARNKVRDYFRSARHRETSVDDSADEASTGYERFGSGESSSEDRTRLQRTLGIVRQALLELDEYCRLLLKMAGEEFLPREMIRVLGWKPEKAKKVSDDLRYCRRKLRDLLDLRGVSYNL